MLLNIILSHFQQYRTLLAKVIQFFVSPEKCENQRYKFLTPDWRYVWPSCDLRQADWHLYVYLYNMFGIYAYKDNLLKGSRLRQSVLHINRLQANSGAGPGFQERGFICIKVWGVRFANFISNFLNVPWKWNNLVSQRPNYFIFIGYFITRERGSSEPPLDPPLNFCKHV